MADDFFDNNAGAGDDLWSTGANWNNGTVPTTGDNAFVTDVRAATSITGETVAEATLPSKILFTRYSGNVGDTGTHLVFTAAAGDDDIDELRIEECTGKFYFDLNHTGGDDEITDTHINVPGQASDQINLGGTADWVNVHLLRGRTNLGMTGTLSNLWVAHSTTPRDVRADIAAGATVTNIRQGGGKVTCASTQAIALWMQDAGTTLLTGSNTITDYYVRSGNVRIDGSGTALVITNLYVYSGMADLTKAGNLRTLTNIFVWPGGTIDMRGVENLVTNTKIVQYGNGRILGNKQPTQTFS